MRLLTLYLRARGVPAAFGVLLVATLGFWALGLRDPRLVALTIGLGVSVAAGGLGGHDTDLDRTAAIAWPPRRALHLAGIATVLAGLVFATNLSVAEVIVRDCAGLTGLAALGAAVLGRQLAWCPPVTWTLCSAMSLPPNEVLAWLVQPPGTTAATVTAAVLGLAGTACYTVSGPRGGSA
jgi:hypothetical protein